MIIVLNKQIESSDKERIVDYLKEKGFRVREIQGESDTVLGAVGSAATASASWADRARWRMPNKSTLRQELSPKAAA